MIETPSVGVGTTIPPQGLGRTASIVFIALAALIPLVFALVTNHIWEDYFITFRHSRNLCEGHGLVYQPGERVHGFTSPLGVLLPALGYWITGAKSYLAALWVLRILGIVALAGAGWLLLQTAARAGTRTLPLLVLALLFLFDIKATAFSVNGMETAFLLLFLVWGFALAAGNAANTWRANGVCWAALMWTRPDGCVYIAVLALLAFNFGEGDRRERFLAILKSGLVCTVLYLPWVLWAWSYYGSPIPHTIVAKAHGLKLFGVPSSPLGRIGPMLPKALAAPFRPVYFEWGGWPESVNIACLALGIFCACYWLLPVNDRIGRMASMAYFLLCVYLSYVVVLFPWYLPPIAMLGYLVLARALNSALATLAPEGSSPRPQFPALRILALVLGVLVCIGQVVLFSIGAVQMGIRQAEIEDRHRIPLGLWLKERVKPGERIYLEPLGYIGYFSDAKMLDYPGLVSPEVVQAIDDGCDHFSKIAMHLQPEWMILRPWEREAMLKEPDFERDYSEVAVFNARPRLADYPRLPGRAFVEYDSIFYVYHRK